MALSKRGGGVWWSRTHFLIRFAGLTGVLAVLAGLMLLAPAVQWSALNLSSWATVQAWVRGEVAELFGRVETQYGADYLRAIQLLFLVGASLALIAVVVEFVGVALLAAGR